MADKEGNVLAKDYGIGIAPPERPFPVKGHASAGWGMQSRLGQIFADDGRTIMLAFDHGYIMGSTAGLERLDLTIPPLMQYADCLMATRGALRTCIPANHHKAVALRCTADTSVLKDDMSFGNVGVEIEDAIRMNASCMAVQCFVGTGIKLFRKFIAAMIVEISGIHIKYQLTVFDGIRFQTSGGDHAVLFHLLKHFYIIVRGCFEMDVQRSAFRHDVLIAVAVLFTLIVFLYLSHICRGFQVLISGYGTVYSIISCHRIFVLSLRFADSGELRRGTFSKCNNPL